MQSPNALRPETIASTLSGHTDDIADVVADALTFLKLDGSRAMTGNLDLNGHLLQFTSSALKQETGQLACTNRPGTSYQNFRCYTFLATSFYGMGNPSYFRPAENREIHFQTYAGLKNVANLSDVTEDLSISRAGDITLLEDKILNLLGAEIQIPCAIPASPLLGHMWYDAPNDILYLRDAIGWKAH